ncbi:hypothetical protein JAB4_056680 (plasmid) [Janthinobacterium sp. HH102]|nr:hypothetical protein JAB4_056680 [Janthinobacterium sp. HH102]
MARSICCTAPGRRQHVPAADHRPGPRRRRRRAARGPRSGQHRVDGVLQLLHGAWPAPTRSCSRYPAGSSTAPPARRTRLPRWPTPRRRRAPAAARCLAGANTFLQLITGRILADADADAAGAPRAAAAVAHTGSMARSSCCTAPGRRQHVPAADHRPGPRRRRRRRARPPQWPAPGRWRAPAAARRLAGANTFLQQISGRILDGAAGAPNAAAAVANTTSTARTSCCTAPGRRQHVPAADHRPDPRRRRRRARPPQWPTPGRWRAPAAARRLAGANTFLQLITGRAHAGAAGAPRAAPAVASTGSMACSSCCTAPGRRQHVPAADIRPDPRRRRRRAERGCRGGQHHVDGAHQLLHGAWPAPTRSCS